MLSGMRLCADLERLAAPGPVARGRRFRVLLIAVGACAASLSTAGTVAAHSVLGSQSVSRSHMVVAATRGSRSGLFSVSASGKLRPLAPIPAAQSEPDLSPSGAKLAYVQAGKTKCYQCPFSIWLSKANGSGGHILTPPLPGTLSVDGSPSFSPNGAQIVFSRQTNISYSLYVASVAGGIPHNLFVPGVSPAWGPSRIAYLSPPTQAPGPVTLWTIDSHGAAPKKLATGYIVAPTWSSGGSLAYLDQPPGSRPTLTVIAGASVRHYPLPFAQAKSLAWAPNGTQLAVVAATKRSGPFDVYTIGADGKGVTRLTVGAAATGVTWSR